MKSFFLKLFCRSRIVTTLIAWLQLRNYYKYSIGKIRGAPANKNARPPSRLGVLAFHLLSYQPSALLLQWLPTLQFRRSYLYAGAIEPHLRYEYLYQVSQDRLSGPLCSLPKQLPSDPARSVDIDGLPAVREMWAERARRKRNPILRTNLPNLQILET